MYVIRLFGILSSEYFLVRVPDLNVSCWSDKWRNMLNMEEVVEEHKTFVFIVIGEQLISVVQLLSTDMSDRAWFVVMIASLQVIIAFPVGIDL